MGELPTLLPGEDSAIRRKFEDWLDRKRLRPRITGEFDDTALMTAFGRAGVGAFAVPTAIEQEILGTGDLVVLGRAEEVRIDALRDFGGAATDSSLCAGHFGCRQGGPGGDGKRWGGAAGGLCE